MDTPENEQPQQTLPPIPLLPRKPLKAVKGLLGWIVAMAWLALGTSFLTAIPDLVHSVEYRMPSHNSALEILAFPVASNPEEDCLLSPQLRPIRDYRSEAEQAYDESLIFDDEDPRSAAAYGVLMLNALLVTVCAIGSITGGILTMVLIYRLVHNALILDPKGKHSSPTWATVSCLVPIASLFVPCRELWRAWKGIARTHGQQASGLLMALWWGLFLVSPTVDQINMRTASRNIILPGDVALAGDLLDIAFFTACIALFSRMRRCPDSTPEI